MSNSNQANFDDNLNGNKSDINNHLNDQSTNHRDQISNNIDQNNNNQQSMDDYFNNIPSNYPANNAENYPKNIPDNYPNNNNSNNSENTIASTYQPTQDSMHLDQLDDDDDDDDLHIESSEDGKPKPRQKRPSFKPTPSNQHNTNSTKSSKLSAQDLKRKDEFRELMKKKECLLFRCKLKNYHSCGNENGFTIYARNLFPFARHFLIPSRSNSEGREKTEKSVNLSSTYSQPQYLKKIKSEEKNRSNLMRIQFLSHIYNTNTLLSSFNEDLLVSQITCYMKNLNIALANFKGISITNNEKHFFPTVLIERPQNGPLSSLFETINKNRTESSSANSSNKPNISRCTSSLNINKINAIYPDQKFALICGITDGIAFIHSNDLIHSNLNPTTIYLDGYLHPKICDYIFIPPYRATTVENTGNTIFKYNFDKKPEPNDFQNPLFVAPEIFNNEEFGSAADIYSLGLLMYFILTEKEPTLDNGQIVYPNNFGAEWKNLIDRCISHDKASRPTAISILKELFDENNMKIYLSTISSDENNTEITLNNENYFKLLKKSINDDFDCQRKEFDIFHNMIPNADEIDEDTEMIILAAETGDPKSIKKVGDFLLKGENKILCDENCAYTCYNEAADRGDVESMILTAKFNEEGIGSDINYEIAFKYYTKAYQNMDENDPKRSEIKLKLDELPPKIEQNRTITLYDIPLNLDSQRIKSLFPRYKFRIERVPPNEGEDHQQIKVIFDEKSHFRNTVSKQNRQKLDYFIICGKKYKFSYPSSKPSELTRLKSLNLFLKSIDIDDYYPGKDNQDFKLLGQGAYAKTYLVYRKSDEHPFAAKILKPIESEQEINFFKREIISASRFKHPAIVHYEGFNEFSLVERQKKSDANKPTPTLLMNFIPKDNLEKIIQDQPIDWNDTTKLKTIIGIVSGMTEMYSKNIVHRDLKPENILLNEKYEPVICDFGCARQYSNYRQLLMSAARGTIIYMAPELLVMSYEPIYKFEVDVYSFGIILYQILTDKTCGNIYPKNVIQNKMRLSKAKQNNYVGEIPEDLEIHKILTDLVKSCWNASFDERPDPLTIFNRLVDAVNNDVKLLPYADLDEVKEYINTLIKAE